MFAMCEHTATVRGTSVQDGLGNERRRAWWRGSAEGELPAFREFDWDGGDWDNG